MNSVALPASATANVMSAESDLVRQAARGDAEAFGELFRRHGAPAWRLAQAVSPDKDAAVASFRDGFAKAVKSGRFGRRTADTFRPQVLASVYKSAIDQAYDRAATPALSRRSAAGPEAALADAAYRSLPERWRAALWLREVESLDAERIGEVLGVSGSVAEQLVSRARRGLAGRFAQAHHEAPEHIGDVLRPLALAQPANLADVAAARWSTAGADRMPIFAPLSGWLEDRAIRPMSVAVGSLIALGVIGLGVVDTSGAVRSQLGASGNGSLGGAVPVQTCFGIACPAGGAAGATNGLAAYSFPAGGSGSGSGLGGSASSLGGSGGGIGTGAGGGGGLATGSGGSGSGSGSGPGLPGGTQLPGTPGPSPSPLPSVPQLPVPTTVPNPAPTPVVTVPLGSSSVSVGGSSLVGANVNGTTSVGLVCTSGLICSGTGTTSSPSTTAPSTTTTTLPLQKTVTSTIGQLTTTATTLLPGL